MIECLIVGDSIAVGVSQVRHECMSIAKSGINSSDWNKQNIQKLKPTKNYQDLFLICATALGAALKQESVLQVNF